MHSCVVYPIENHFKNKEFSKNLFLELATKVEKHVGEMTIDSRPCCIHLDNDSTFVAIWLLKDIIRLDFSTTNEIESSRILKYEKIAAHRYINYLELKSSDDIDQEFLNWIKESYDLMKSDPSKLTCPR